MAIRLGLPGALLCSYTNSPTFSRVIEEGKAAALLIIDSCTHPGLMRINVTRVPCLSQESNLAHCLWMSWSKNRGMKTRNSLGGTRLSMFHASNRSTVG
ncbi:hypothetical protein BDN67DRAFT_969880 [Paxillus ammoniavirescens]|nr:hypothetical protein BDN67DRAFT_969880 [Paxillus ammoniavirescens]